MNVKKQLNKFQNQLHNSVDVATRLVNKNGVDIGFLFLKSMTDNKIFSEDIFSPISNCNIVNMDNVGGVVQAKDIKFILEDEVVENVLKGVVVILLSNDERFLAVDILSFPTRPPQEPPTSPVIMGPREGFTESMQTNITLLRRRVGGNELVLHEQKVGSITQTQVVVAYLKGVANEKIVKEVKKRISKIKIDGIVDSYYIVAMISERPNSIFKQVGCTEKPDVVAAKMLEGRVAIIVDNSPIVLTVPFLFFEDVQNSNDYYTNYAYSTLVRFVRVLALFLSVLGPGFYIALELFHINILPIKYLITIADSTQQIPFTPFIEILFVYVLFQILYEVSLRLPSYLGLATSVVGALILGDAGVKAGLLSPPTVIVVAIAKIALYAIPEQSSQINILQFVFTMLGAAAGILGLIGGVVYILAYMNTIENFDAPYLAPFSPFILGDNKDGVLKVPLTEMDELPKSIKNDVEERTDVVTR